MTESASLFILIKSLTKYNTGVCLSSLTGSNSPRETQNTHYIMLHWGLLPRLTMEVAPQGLYTIMTSRKEVNTSLMGVHQHIMIIYIRIYSEVTNTSTLTLNQEGILSLPQSSTHLVQSSSQSHHHGLIIIAASIIIFLSIIERYYCHRKFLHSQPFFMLGVSLVLIQVFITFVRNPSHSNYP